MVPTQVASPRKEAINSRPWYFSQELVRSNSSTHVVSENVDSNQLMAQKGNLFESNPLVDQPGVYQASGQNDRIQR